MITSKSIVTLAVLIFVLENKEPRPVKSEEEKQTRHRKSQKRSSGKKKSDRSGNQHFTSQKRKENKGRSDVIKNMNSKKKFNRQKQFVIRRKEK